MQDFWFAIYVVLIGAALSAVYGAVSSMPALLVGMRVRRLRLQAVGVVFAATAFAIQLGLILLVEAAPIFVWHAAAYAMLGAVAALLTFRYALRRAVQTSPAGAAR